MQIHSSHHVETTCNGTRISKTVLHLGQADMQYCWICVNMHMLFIGALAELVTTESSCSQLVAGKVQLDVCTTFLFSCYCQAAASHHCPTLKHLFN